MNMDRTQHHGSVGKKENENSSANEENSKKDSTMSESPEMRKFHEMKKSIPMLQLLLRYLTSIEATDNAPRQEILVKKVKNILTTLNSDKPSEKCDLITLERIENVVESLTGRMAPKLKEFEKHCLLAKPKNTPHMPAPTPPVRAESSSSSSAPDMKTPHPRQLDTIDLTSPPKKLPGTVPAKLAQVESFLSNDKIRELREKMQKRKAILDQAKNTDSSPKSDESSKVNRPTDASLKLSHDSHHSSRTPKALDLNRNSNSSSVKCSESRSSPNPKQQARDPRLQSRPVETKAKHEDSKLQLKTSSETDRVKKDATITAIKTSERSSSGSPSRNSSKFEESSKDIPFNPTSTNPDREKSKSSSHVSRTSEKNHSRSSSSKHSSTSNKHRSASSQSSVQSTKLSDDLFENTNKNDRSHQSSKPTESERSYKSENRSSSLPSKGSSGTQDKNFSDIKHGTLKPAEMKIKSDHSKSSVTSQGDSKTDKSSTSSGSKSNKSGGNFLEKSSSSSGSKSNKSDGNFLDKSSTSSGSKSNKSGGNFLDKSSSSSGSKSIKGDGNSLDKSSTSSGSKSNKSDGNSLDKSSSSLGSKSNKSDGNSSDKSSTSSGSKCERPDSKHAEKRSSTSSANKPGSLKEGEKRTYMTNTSINTGTPQRKPSFDSILLDIDKLKAKDKNRERTESTGKEQDRKKQEDRSVKDSRKEVKSSMNILDKGKNESSPNVQRSHSESSLRDKRSDKIKTDTKLSDTKAKPDQKPEDPRRNDRVKAIDEKRKEIKPIHDSSSKKKPAVQSTGLPKAMPSTLVKEINANFLDEDPLHSFATEQLEIDIDINVKEKPAPPPISFFKTYTVNQELEEQEMDEELIYDAIIKNPLLKQPLKVMEKLKDKNSSLMNAAQDYASPASPPLFETGFLETKSTAIVCYDNKEKSSSSSNSPSYSPVSQAEEKTQHAPPIPYSELKKISHLKSGALFDLENSKHVRESLHIETLKPIVPHPNITDKKSLDIRNLPTSKSQANAWETGSDEEKDDLDIPDRSFWSRGDRPMPSSHWRSGNTQSPLDQRARYSQRSADNPDTKPNFDFSLFPRQGNAERVRWAREMPKSPAQNFGERRQSFEGSQDKERNARNSILGDPPHLSVHSPAQNFDDPRKSSLLGFPPHFHKNSIAQSFEDTRNSSSSILGAPPPLNTGYRKSDDQHQSYVPYQSSASHRDPRSEKSMMESRSPAIRPDWRAQYSMNSPRYTGMSPRPSQSSWTPRGSSSPFVNNRSSWSRNTDPRESPNTDWSKNVEPWMGENRNVYAPNVPVRKTSAPLTYGQYLAMKKEQEAAKKAAEEKLKVAEEEVHEKEKKDVDDKSVRDPRLRAKSPETFVSPLGDVTYSNLPAPKTGRGYGPQVAYRPHRPTLTETKPIEPPIKPTFDEKQAFSTKESKLSQDMKDDERSLVIDELGPQKTAAFESKEETKNDKDINKEDTQEASNENTTSVHFAEKAQDITLNPTKEESKAQEKVSSDFIEEKSDKEGVEVSEQKQEESPSLTSRGNIVGDVCEPPPVSTNNRPIQEGPNVEAERIQDSRDLKHAPVDTPDSTTHDLFESSSSVQVESSATVGNETPSPVTDTAAAAEEENPLLLLPNNVMLKILASDKEMIKNFMSLLQKKKKRHSSSSSSEESSSPSSCSSSSSSSSEEEKGKLESKHKKKKKRKKKKKKKKRKIKVDIVGASSASIPVSEAATQPRIMTNPAESDLNKPSELIELENFKIPKNMFKDNDFNAPQNDFSDNEEEDVSFSLNDVISKSSLFDKDEDQPVSDEASKTDESSAEKSNENKLKQSNETNFEQSEKTAEQSNETTLERNQSNQTALEFLDSLTEEESQREIESEKNKHSELKQFEEIASHQSYETALEKSNELALDETSETVLEQSNETSLGQSDKTTSEKDKEITLNYSSAPTSELDESNQEQRQREIELEESKDKPVSKHTKNKWTELDRLHSDLMENFKDIANISSVRSCRMKQSETPSPPSNRVSPIKSDEKKTLDKIEESGTESQLNTSKEDDVSDYAETKTPSQAKKITKKKKKSLGFGSKKRPKKKIAKPAEPSSDKVASHKAAVEKADELSSEDTESITTPQEISAVEAQTTTSKPTKTKGKAGPKSRKSKRTLRKPSEEIVPPQALTEKLDYLSSEDFDSESVASLRDGSAAESNRSTFKSPPTKIKRGKRSPTGPLRRSLRSTVPVSEEKPKTTSEASDSESVEDSEKESVVTGNEMESDLSDVEQPALESILSRKPGPKSKTRSCYFGNVPIQQPIILLDNLDSREANRVVSALGKTPSEKSGEINNELDPAIFNDVEYFQTDGPTNCKLCAKKFTSKIILTQHYKHVHPNCNIVPSSRFSKEVAQLVKSKSEQEELEYLENVDIIEGNFPLSRQKYGQKMRMYSCHFCDYKKVSKFGAYLTHVSFHTGEYRYKCPLNCFFTTNYKKSMKTHFKDQHAESGKEVMECYKPIDYQMDLFGYLCKVCNYVQLLKSNMRKHFVLGHKDIDNVDACMVRIDMSGHSVTAKPDLGDAESRFLDFDDNDSTDCDDNNLVGSSVLNEIMQDFMTRPGEVSSVLNMNLLDDEAFPEEGTRSEQSKESVLKSTKQNNAADSMDRNFETEKHLKSQSIEQIVASFEDLDKKSKSSDVTTKDSVEAKALNKSTIPPFKNSHDEKLDIETIINTNTHNERLASANNKENNIDIGESQKKEKRNLLSKLTEKMSANINVPDTDDEKSGKETKVVETEMHNSKLIEQTKPTVLEKERLDDSQESSTVEKVTTVIPSPQTPSTSKPPGFNSPRLSGRKSFNEPQIAATLKKLEIKIEPSDSPLGTIQYTDEERRKMWLDQMNSFYQKETLYRPNAELRENLSKLLSKKLLPDESPQKESQKGSTSKAPPKVTYSEIPSHDHDYSTSKGTLPVQPLSTALSTLRQRKLPERNCKLNVIVPEEEDLEDEVASEFLPCSNAQVSPNSDDMSLVNPAELLNITGGNKSSIALKLFNVLSNTGAVQPSTSADVYSDQSIFGGPSHAFEPVTLDGADQAFGALSTFQPLDHEDGHVPVENDAVWDTSFTPGSPERVQYSVKIKAGMVSVSLSADHKHIKYACNVPQCNYSVPRLDDFYNHVHTKHEEVTWNGWCSHCPKKDLVDETLLMAVAHVHVDHLIKDFNIVSESVPSMLDFLKTTSFKPGARKRSTSCLEPPLKSSVVAAEEGVAVIGGASSSELDGGKFGLRIRRDIFCKEELESQEEMSAEQRQEGQQEDGTSGVDESLDWCPVISSVKSLKSIADFSTEESNPSTIDCAATSAPSCFSITNPLDSTPIMVQVPALEELEQERLLKRRAIPQLDYAMFTKNQAFHSTSQFSIRMMRLKESATLARMLSATRIVLDYKCCAKTCDFATSHDREFMEHCRSHVRGRGGGAQKNRSAPWELCCYCGKRYVGAPGDLVLHMKMEHGYCVHQCAYCFYRAYAQASVFWHQEYAHPNRPIRIFTLSPMKEADLYGHLPSKASLEIMKKSIDQNVLPYWCVDCKFSTYLLKTLLMHFNSLHSDLTLYQCGLCSNQSMTLSSLVLHYKHIHRNQLWHCCYCPHNCESFELIQVHLISLHPQLVPQCIIRLNKAGQELNHTQDDLMVIPLTERSLTSSELVPASEDLEDESGVIIIEPPDSTVATIPGPSASSVGEAVNTGLKSSSIGVEVNNATVDENLLSSSSSLECEVVGDKTAAVKSQAEVDRASEKELSGKELYRCGNSGCSFAAPKPNVLKEHMMCCDHFRNQSGDRIQCYHCSKTFQTILRLLEHLETHGVARYHCGLCSFRHPRAKPVHIHIRKMHTYKSDLIEESYERGKPGEFNVVFPKCVRDNSQLTGSGDTSGGGVKVGFSLDDLDTLAKLNPTPSVPLLCSSCGYRANTTLNLIRHLKEGQHITTRADLTNDIPSLNSGDLMFNKMTNHALSSNLNTGFSLAEETNYEKIPKFVPINKRLVCTFCNPHYLSQDEILFKHHFSSLHSDEIYYLCPHCSPDSQNEPITVDKIGVHLKFHGGKLFKCSYCDFLHHARHLVDRHLGERHSEAEPSWVLVRDLNESAAMDDNTTARSYRRTEEASSSGDKVSSAASTPARKWRCNLCRNRYPDIKAMRKHLSSQHRYQHQFKCMLCDYGVDVEALNDAETGFAAHFGEKHPATEWSKAVLALFSLTLPEVDSSNLTSAEDAIDTPSALYKLRADSSLARTIRGIALETTPHTARTENIAHRTVLETQDDMYGPHGEPHITTTGPPQFVCPTCNRFRSREAVRLREHLYMEKEYHRWRCNLCGFQSLYHKAIVNHHTSVHENETQSLTRLAENTLLQGWVERVLETQRVKMLSKPTAPSTPSVPVTTSANPSRAVPTLGRHGSSSSINLSSGDEIIVEGGPRPRGRPKTGGPASETRKTIEKRGYKRKRPGDQTIVEPAPPSVAQPSSPCEIIDIEDISDPEFELPPPVTPTPTPTPSPKKPKVSILRGEPSPPKSLASPSKTTPTKVFAGPTGSKAGFTSSTVSEMQKGPCTAAPTGSGARVPGTLHEDDHILQTTNFLKQTQNPLGDASTGPSFYSERNPQHKRPLSSLEGESEASGNAKRSRTVKSGRPPGRPPVTSELMKKNDAIKETLKTVIHCRECGNSYTSVVGLKMHISRTHHRPKSINYFCQYCDAQLPEAAQIRVAHFISAHPGLEPRITSFDPYQKVTLTDKFWVKEYGLSKKGYITEATPEENERISLFKELQNKKAQCEKAKPEPKKNRKRLKSWTQSDQEEYDEMMRSLPPRSPPKTFDSEGYISHIYEKFGYTPVRKPSEEEDGEPSLTRKTVGRKLSAVDNTSVMEGRRASDVDPLAPDADSSQTTPDAYHQGDASKQTVTKPCPPLIKVTSPRGKVDFSLYMNNVYEIDGELFYFRGWSAKLGKVELVNKARSRQCMIDEGVFLKIARSVSKGNKLLSNTRESNVSSTCNVYTGSPYSSEVTTSDTWSYAASSVSSHSDVATTSSIDESNNSMASTGAIPEPCNYFLDSEGNLIPLGADNSVVEWGTPTVSTPSAATTSIRAPCKLIPVTNKPRFINVAPQVPAPTLGQVRLGRLTIPSLERGGLTRVPSLANPKIPSTAPLILPESITIPSTAQTPSATPSTSKSQSNIQVVRVMLDDKSMSEAEAMPTRLDEDGDSDEENEMIISLDDLENEDENDSKKEKGDNNTPPYLEQNAVPDCMRQSELSIGDPSPGETNVEKTTHARDVIDEEPINADMGEATGEMERDPLGSDEDTISASETMSATDAILVDNSIRTSTDDVRAIVHYKSGPDTTRSKIDTGRSETDTVNEEEEPHTIPTSEDIHTVTDDEDVHTVPDDEDVHTVTDDEEHTNTRRNRIPSVSIDESSSGDESQEDVNDASKGGETDIITKDGEQSNKRGEKIKDILSKNKTNQEILDEMALELDEDLDENMLFDETPDVVNEVMDTPAVSAALELDFVDLEAGECQVKPSRTYGKPLSSNAVVSTSEISGIDVDQTLETTDDNQITEDMGTNNKDSVIDKTTLAVNKTFGILDKSIEDLDQENDEIDESNESADVNKGGATVENRPLSREPSSSSINFDQYLNDDEQDMMLDGAVTEDIGNSDVEILDETSGIDNASQKGKNNCPTGPSKASDVVVDEITLTDEEEEEVEFDSDAELYETEEELKIGSETGNLKLSPRTFKHYSPQDTSMLSRQAQEFQITPNTLLVCNHCRLQMKQCQVSKHYSEKHLDLPFKLTYSQYNLFAPDPMNKYVFQCSYCAHRTCTPEEIMQHWKRRHKTVLHYKNNKCKLYNTGVPLSYSPLMQGYDQVPVLECYTCERIGTETYLKLYNCFCQDRICVNQSVKWGCTHCGKEYSNIVTMYNHVCNKHQHHPHETIDFECSLCETDKESNQSYTLHSLLGHVLLSHFSAYRCKLCLEVFLKENQMMNHLIFDHELSKAHSLHLEKYLLRLDFVHYLQRFLLTKRHRLSAHCQKIT